MLQGEEAHRDGFRRGEFAGDAADQRGRGAVLCGVHRRVGVRSVQ